MSRMVKELRDQSLHVLACVLTLLPVTVYPCWATGIFSGFMAGLIRETAQHDTFKFWTLGRGSALDLSFWSLGGLLVGVAGTL